MGFLRRKPTSVILYLLHSGNLYGTERMALATLTAMDEYQERVVFAPRPGGDGSVAVAARDAGFVTVQFESRWDLVRQLLPWFLRYRAIDVIGTGVAQSYVCHALAKLFFVHIRQLQVAHGGAVDADAYGRKRRLNGLPICIVAVSEFVRDKLIQHGVTQASIRVIANFLSDSQRREYLPRPRYDSGGPSWDRSESKPTRVIVVSRVDPIKKIDVLIDAIEKQGLNEFQFDVFGTGSHLDLMRERAAPLANITFHGFVPDIKPKLRAADFLLHLCPDEPFGLVILEAFLTQLVVVVPDAGGAGNLVEDGVNGLRFRADDVQSLCTVLRAARSSTGPRLQQIADNARTVLDDRYSQNEGVRRYREAFRASFGSDDRLGSAQAPASS
ncbi:MAG: glycosyltransferase family 4 protein [Caldimonas sp.]